MSCCRLLYLEGQRLFAYHWQDGELRRERVFEANIGGWQAFEDYLAGQREARFRLLTNLADEGFAQESIPFLWGRDRQALIARKIGQHFPGTPLSLSLSLGREKTRRREEKLLILALTKAGDCEPWLARLAQAEIALSGIYSSAQLAGTLLRKLGRLEPRCILICILQHSIRETYLLDGQPMFSRLAVLAEAELHDLAARLATEASQLQHYLIGQRLIGREEAIPIHILAPSRAIPLLEESCRTLPGLAFSFIDRDAAARRLKLKTLSEDDGSEQLLLHLLAIAAPSRQFADRQQRHHFRIAQISQVLRHLSLAVLLGSLGWAAQNAWRAHDLETEARALATTEADLNRRYQEIAATFPHLGIRHETLRQLTDAFAQLQQRQQQPTTAFRMLGHAMDQEASIELDSIDWKIDRKVTAAAEEITTIEGHITTGSDATPRQIHETFEHFKMALLDNPSSTLDVLRPPFAVTPNQPLSGEGDFDTGAGAPPSHFSLRMTRRLTP